jgi:hypothetical protein
MMDRRVRFGGALVFPMALLSAPLLAPLGCASHTAHVTNSGDAGPSNVCGNGKVESGETCDGTSLNGASCTSLGFDSGQLQCAQSCKFDTSQCVGSITLTVNPSRTSCAAPCAVFFDATATTGLQNGDYVGANFNWDFDSTNVDPANGHRSTIGFVTAHVFDVPGTYQVAVRVRDLVGHAGTTTVPITVAALSGATLYVSSSKGSDSNAGTMAQPFKTLAGALMHNAAQTSILLKRGDTFDLGLKTTNLKGTAYLIGAYTDSSGSSSPAPILTSSVPTSGFGSIIDIEGVSDIRLVGLHVVASAGAFTGMFLNNSQHILFEGVEIEGIGLPSGSGTNSFQLGSGADGTFIVDCHMHDFDGYGVYGDRSTHFAVIGTTIEKFSGGDHGIRIQGGNAGTQGFANDSYVAESMINPNPDSSASFDAAAFRGDDTNIVEVNNRMQRVISFTPQNLQQVEHISNVLIEGNVLSDSTVPTNTQYTAVSIRAQHVVVRNNVIWNPSFVAVDVEGHPLLPANFVDQVSVYNNTVFVLPPSGVPASTTIHFLQHLGTTGSVTVQNNIFSVGTTSNASGYITSDGMGTETEDHNLGFAPNVSGSWKGAPSGTGDVVADPLFVSTDMSNAQALRLSPGSPALDVGASTPAFQDLTGSARPQGAGWDLGAFEMLPSAATPDGSADGPGTTTAHR